MNISVDFLSATYHVDPLLFTRVQMPVVFARAINQQFAYRDSGYYSYNNSLVSKTGALIMWNDQRREMGVHVAFNGATLSTIDWYDAMVSTLKNENATLTRVDIAIDTADFLGDKNTDILEYYEKTVSGEFVGRKRKIVPVGLIESGITIYVGSRTSDKYLRIYDKAKERGIENSSWVRLELVVKGDAARSLTSKLRSVISEERGREGVGRVLIGVFKSFIWFRNYDFDNAFSAFDTVTLKSDKLSKNTLRWLNGMVPTIARNAALNPDWFREFSRDLENAIKVARASLLATSVDNSLGG